MIVLDTNVVSELARQHPDAAVVGWLDSVTAAELTTTAISAAELLYGIARVSHGHRKAELTEAVWGMVNEDFRDHIEVFDTIAASHYAAIVAERERLGRPISMADAQIAAICRRLQATLATRNTEDFEDTGIEVLNPWNRP